MGREASIKGERSPLSMRSTVNWAVLGLVIERPSYGFELWTRFERLAGDVLPVASESHIYAALNALKGRGFIEEADWPGAVERDTSRQPKLRYRVTAEGQEAYEVWMMAQVREASGYCEVAAVTGQEAEGCIIINGNFGGSSSGMASASTFFLVSQATKP